MHRHRRQQMAARTAAVEAADTFPAAIAHAALTAHVDVEGYISPHFAGARLRALRAESANHLE
jgi:hypothetical protein